MASETTPGSWCCRGIYQDLPPPAIGDSGGFDAMGLLAANKGKAPMEGIVE